MRLGWRTLETVLWLGFYAAAAIFLLTYDGTSPTYSDLMLKERSTDRPPEATRDLPAGSRLGVVLPAP